MPSDIQETFVEQENVPESYQEIFGEGDLIKDTISYESNERERERNANSYHLHFQERSDTEGCRI